MVSKYFIPHPLKNPSQMTFCSNQMQQCADIMTANDATINERYNLD